MSQIKINKINSDVVWELIWKAWDLGRVNYILSLTIVFVFFAALMVGLIPFVGILISGAVGALAPLVFFQASQAWEKGEKSDVKKVMSVFDNKERLQALAPLIGISFLFSAGPTFLQQLPVVGVLAAPLPLLTFPVTIILGMAYPIQFFNFQTVDIKKAISLAAEGLWKNIIPFIVGFFLIAVLSVICTVLLLLPLFLIVGPIFITYNYLWYRVVYEDLVLEVKDEGVI